MQSPPAESLIRFKGQRLLKLFLPLFILMAISIAIHPQQWLHLSLGGQIFWLCFGLSILAAWIWLPQRVYLVLNRQGLEIKTLFNRQHYTWREIVNPRLQRGRMGIILVFDLAQGAKRIVPAGVSQVITGYDVSLLDYYEMCIADILMLILAWQQKLTEQDARLDAPL